MAPVGSFENKYEEFTPEIAKNILNETFDSISDGFHRKLHKFQSHKLKILLTDMKTDIFYDGTVYTGSAGLAMYYVMAALGKNDANLDTLKRALPFINLNTLKGKRISFLCGDAGPLALAAVIAYKLRSRRPDHLPDHKSLISRLMSLTSLLNDSPDEILYGRSGYLYGLLFVNKYIGGKDAIPANHIEQVVNAILRSGKQLSTQMNSACPLMWKWHDKIYFGGAHGMAGILYMLLQARQYLDVLELRSFIKPSLDWLLKRRSPSGNYPSSQGSSSGDRLVQWCHGAPGFTPLCLLAYEIFEEENYLNLALQCGEVVWQRGLSTKGYSLCHGVSGNAYTFIQLYQVTKDPVHLYRAGCFMEWCAVEQSGTELHAPDRPASLFEGLVGRLHLAEDLKHVAQAKFPAYTL